jgi:hypothetical protein
MERLMRLRMQARLSGVFRKKALPNAAFALLNTREPGSSERIASVS